MCPTTVSIRKAWADTKKDAGLTNFRCHDLRHETVSQLVEAGVSGQEVAAISGHKSMQMLKRYTHLRAEDLVEKLDKLDCWAPAIGQKQPLCCDNWMSFSSSSR